MGDKTMWRGVLVSVFCLQALGASAAQFVASPPLAQVVNTPVGHVAPGPVQVPIITWGGDIATVLANGNGAVTTPASAFGRAGLNLRLVRQDVFAKQLEDYMAGRSPYLRGTLGMLNMAAELASRDARTRPVVVQQLTWSAGGDALVVTGAIRSARDLKGKTVALQAYGPHVDYMAKILADAGLTPRDVAIKWVSDLTGSKNTPAAALRDNGVDAAFVITPDALALTSNGTVGTGAEDSVRGARILLTTKSASRIIADVYAVRADFLQARRAEVEKFAAALTQAQEDLRALVAAKPQRAAEYKATFSAAAQLLLDSPQAVADAEGLYGDAEFVRLAGNVDFFARDKNPRGFAALTREIQSAFVPLGLLGRSLPLEAAKWDYARFGQGGAAAQAAATAESPIAPAPRFDPQAVAGVVAQRQAQGKLGEGELFSFEVLFKPNQDKFPAEQYTEAFRRVLNLASTYAGAIITVEGHSDPLGYLQAKKAGSPEVVLGRTAQSARNLSLARAVAVRESVIAYARSQGVALDPSQFAVLGHGIQQPKTGLCGSDPCAPKTEQEWLSNMRVQFRLVQVEAEASAFKPI
jgi:ABC-type nitrate/sulfonate/bicarbonate transport system substrate-binding protein/outer membrane protein OmpA-like peptidoglycan-associated protein